MRIRTTDAAVTAVLALSPVGRSSDSDSSAESKGDSERSSEPAAPSSESAASNDADGSDSSEADEVVPSEPTGDARSAVIAALRDVDPALVQDEDKVIEEARYPCGNLDGGDSGASDSAPELFT